VAMEVEEHEIAQGVVVVVMVDVTLTRFWRVGEEKFDTIETGGFYEQISTDLYKRIQATSSSLI
jgi:hypothetical protein